MIRHGGMSSLVVHAVSISECSSRPVPRQPFHLISINMDNDLGLYK